MAPRTQKHRLKWPLNAQQVQKLDEMLESLFRDISNNSIFPFVDDGDMLYFDGLNLQRLAIGAANTVIRSNGSEPSWGQVDLTLDVTGTLPAANGGTGIATYTIGDLLYASAATILSKLAAVATGNALISGGVGAAPLWGKVGLTTHVSGTLPIANGGTNSTSTPTAGGAVYGDGTAMKVTAAGTAGQVLTSAGAAAPIWAAASGGSGGITGLLTNGDPANPELMFDSFGDVITV